jgi:hypothetical protein
MAPDHAVVAARHEAFLRAASGREGVVNDQQVVTVSSVLITLTGMIPVEAGPSVAEIAPGVLDGSILGVDPLGRLALLAAFAGIALAWVAGAEAETYVGLLIMAVFWAWFSAAVVVVSAHEGTQRGAAGWAASFAASSLVAAYCFGMLQ